MSSDHNEGSQIPPVLPNQEADKKAEGSIPPAPLTRTKENRSPSDDRSESSLAASKNVVILDPKGTDSDNDAIEANGASGHNNLTVVDSVEATSVTTNDTAASDAAKMKEERKKEKEKKKEQEMLKKYIAEQEAKQRVIGYSKGGRWLKNSVKIGEGGYKFVYRGYDRQDAKNVAWCEFKHEHVDTKEKRQIMFRETEIMLKLNHPNIVQCYDVFREWISEETVDNPIDEKGLIIVQELMSEGTLKQMIKKNFVNGECILKFQLIVRWWHQILDALRYLHVHCEEPIIHRDLKSENCFLYGTSNDDYINVKIGDFGLATQVGSSGRKTMLGTVGFMAPEIFDEMYDEKVDIYAFGMLMLEVMTNRTPYDECATLIDAAAKTMSGHGPEIMHLINNPNISVVISACIHPLACFRPTAEELFCHPLFQPKVMPVEVEPNYEPGADRAEVLERFVKSLANTETRNPRFNLRLRFRDRKMLQELGLDDGESLEFDLDIYKAEDQDIPDLISNLRRDYEDKLSRAFENPKITDRKVITNSLDRLFNSIRMQMQFLVKCLLGRRWKDILDSLTTTEKAAAVKSKQEGPEGGNPDSSSDSDTQLHPVYPADGCSNFEIIAKCKSKWSKAKRMLDREIITYRRAAALGQEGPLPITGEAQSIGKSLAATAQPGLTVVNTAEGIAPLETQSAEGVDDGSYVTPTTSTVYISAGSGQQAIGDDDNFALAGIPMPYCMAVCDAFTWPEQLDDTVVQLHFNIADPDHQQIQPGSPTTFTPHPTPIQPRGQVTQSQGGSGGVVRPSAQQQQQTNQQSFSTVGQVMQGSAPVLAAAGAANVTAPQAAVGMHPGVLQGLQPNTAASSFPLLTTVSSGVNVSSVDQQQSTSVNASFNYLPHQQTTAGQQVQQQPVANYAVNNGPLNYNPQQATRIGDELLNEREETSDTEVIGQTEGVTNYATLPALHHTTNHQFFSIASSPTLIAKVMRSKGRLSESSWRHLVPPLSHAASATSLAYGSLHRRKNPIHSHSHQQQHHHHPRAVFGSPRLLNTTSVGVFRASVFWGYESCLVATSPDYVWTESTPAEQLQHQPQPTGQTHQPPQQQQMFAPTQIQPAGVVQQQQPTQTVGGAKPKRKISQAKPQTSPLRYIIRITHIERESEGCDIPGTLRPTFHLEMPDVMNPKSELWKLSFRCNLSDTTDDIKLIVEKPAVTREKKGWPLKEKKEGNNHTARLKRKVGKNTDWTIETHLSVELLGESLTLKQLERMDSSVLRALMSDAVL
ncbi:hypothetical protein ACTXT7_002165 [Hymenolepis weldensis]